MASSDHETIPGSVTEPVIQAQSLGKTYRKGLRRSPVAALSDFSLTLGRGEVFGLLGPNGAGKTTFIKLLLGAVFPTSGTVRLNGRVAGHPDSRRRVGFLPEQHRFPGHLTAAEVMDCYGRLSGIGRESRRADGERLLRDVGLGDRAHSRVRTYSKGMMQRLGLAQALIGDPTLVVLDEPTDGVDPIGRREIRDLVRQMASEGRTVFLNSHLLSEVEQVCTRAAILDKGRVIAAGTMAELTRPSGSWRVVTTRVEPDLVGRLGLAVDRVPPPEVVSGLHHWLVGAGDRSSLQPVLAALLDAGIELHRVEPERTSLEDSFLRLLKTPDA